MARQCLNNIETDIRILTVRALADEYDFNFEEAIELLNNKFRIETDYYNKFYNTKMAMTKEEHEQYYGENQDNNAKIEFNNNKNELNNNRMEMSNEKYEQNCGTNQDNNNEINELNNNNNNNRMAMSNKENDLMRVINQDARALLENPIIEGMSKIDWGKAMARPNEIIQKNLLNNLGIKSYDPEIDIDCPKIDTTNNSPGFDMVVKNKDGKYFRIQSKLRQVNGNTEFSSQTHFETTRRHSKKNQGAASESGHVAYGCDEFDYVMVTLINVGKNNKKIKNRNDVNNWCFSLIPVNELINKEKNCCESKISAKLLEKYKFDPRTPYSFT
tara:strand:- start:378 stop:1364 length:987 start_codon:yes stop_codon:yes gene_type:complete